MKISTQVLFNILSKIMFTLFILHFLCGCCAFEHKINVEPVVFEDENYKINMYENRR